MIRFCCFRDAVDDRAGLCAINTVNQLPCMFVQAETTQRPFRCVIIKWNFTVIHFQISELIVQMVDGANPLVRLVSNRIFGGFDDLFSAMTLGHRRNTFSHGSTPLRKRWSRFPGLAFGRRSIRHRPRCLRILSGIPVDGLLSGSSGIHKG